MFRDEVGDVLRLLVRAHGGGAVEAAEVVLRRLAGLDGDGESRSTASGSPWSSKTSSRDDDVLDADHGVVRNLTSKRGTVAEERTA